MNEEASTPKIDSQLEARIVALVLGEVSDFDREELNRLIAQRPELRAFKDEIEGVNGVLREIARGEWIGDDEDWKLPPEKRRVVVAAITGQPLSNTVELPIQSGPVNHFTTNSNVFWSIAKIAAVVVGAGFLVSLAMVTMSKTRMAAREQRQAPALLSEEALDWDFKVGDAPASSVSPQVNHWSALTERDQRRFDQTQSSYRGFFDKPNIRFESGAEEFDSIRSLRNGTALGYEIQEGGDARKSLSDLSGQLSGGSAIAAGQVPSVSSRAAEQQQGQVTYALPSTPPVGDFATGMGLGDQRAYYGIQPEAGSSVGGAAPAVEAYGEPENAGVSVAGRSIGRGSELAGLEKDSESSSLSIKKKSPPPTGLDETSAAEQAFSTFSLHVSDVSFKLAQAALAQGEWPESSQIRIEEFVNAFNYGDPLPHDGERVACSVEQAIHPFVQQRNLLRVSIRTGSAGRASNTPLRLTLLVDNSGSMERIDRQQTVRRAFGLLAGQLQPTDQVTLISFAREPRLLADQVHGEQSEQLIQIIESLPSEGGTNIESALQLAFEKAQEQQLEGAQNRIVLLTDGAVNLGDADAESLSRMVATIRDGGIAFDAAGISAEGLNDEILEALTRRGDGRYYLLDSPDAADDGFVRQIAGALRPSAKNVKVQVEFNPNRVGSYKLLGFEKHLLKQEDFRDDSVDAAEMAADEAGVAIYQFEAKPDGDGDVGSVSVRFRDLSSGQMVENRWPIPYEPDAPRADQAAPSMQLATTAAMLAAKLGDEPMGQSVDLKTLANLVAQLPAQQRSSSRVQQLAAMIQQARQLSGN